MTASSTTMGSQVPATDAAPATAGDIVLTFSWSDAIDDLYRSWGREVAAAERVHRLRSERLARLELLSSAGVILATGLAAVGASASLSGAGAGWMAAHGIGQRPLIAALGTLATVAMLAAVARSALRWAPRAEAHRMAALRYGSLDREMRATLALERDARPGSDVALNGVRERMGRFARQSPHVRRRAWIRLAAGSGEWSSTQARSRATGFETPGSPSPA